MNDNKILTITLNPALDLTVNTEIIHLGEVNIAQHGTLHAAGKGINVARVLVDLQMNVTATGILGASNEQAFTDLFREKNIRNEFCREAGNTRINVKLTESNQRTTDINLPGIDISSNTLARFRQTVFNLAEQFKVVVFSGSLPCGISQSIYADLISQVKTLGCLTILDTSGEAFSEAVKAGPTMVKPNREELAQWLGRPVNDIQDEQRAALKLQSYGIKQVVVSDGKNGFRWYGENAIYHVTSPKVSMVSTVGAGDSLVASLAYGLARGESPKQTLERAAAISAHAVEQVGVGIVDMNRLKDLQREVTLTPLTFESLAGE
ncbi:1-phosphofructokinase [Reinekea sp.]|jgi:1-phosphofructokinase|uniref:1-phosphofructokinase n=1 Tax=Reinekea sp. TaxID=1970455 RepID=UPI00398A22F8